MQLTLKSREDNIGYETCPDSDFDLAPASQFALPDQGPETHWQLCGLLFLPCSHRMFFEWHEHCINELPVHQHVTGRRQAGVQTSFCSLWKAATFLLLRDLFLSSLSSLPVFLPLPRL